MLLRVESVGNVVGLLGGTQKERVFFGGQIVVRGVCCIRDLVPRHTHFFLLIWNLLLIKKTKERKNE